MKIFINTRTLQIRMAKKISAEQMKQVEEFVKTLPEDEREERMKEIMEELEKAEDKPQCPFCLMASGSISTFKVFEDQDLLAVLEINPANPGHILLFPKVHVASLRSMNPAVVEALLQMAHTLSNVLMTFNDGANVLFSEGAAAGQKLPHVVVQVIPRVKGDDVQIAWKSKPLGEKELAALREKLLHAIAELAAEKNVVAAPKADVDSVKENLTRQRKRRP